MSGPIAHAHGPIAVVVVTFDSSAVIARCLKALRTSAPVRGLQVLVVDNASTDDSPSIAEALAGRAGVIRLMENRGYAAGVNAGIRVVDAPWIAVLNPDIEVTPGGLDRLADLLEQNPRAGLVGPRTLGHDGRTEPTVGLFPTPSREWAHSWLLDHFGWPGRFAPSPRATRTVDWVSGCAWLARSEALRAAGPLDEGYFMYFEDVDYCRRLHDSGWEVLHTPQEVWKHGRNQGSSATALLPADGGESLLRYFSKFHPELPASRAREMLLRGWRLRLLWRRLRALLGDARSAAVARRYEIAIELVDQC